MSEKPSIQREIISYDLVIVGGGIAGLAAAIEAKKQSADISVIVLEKGSEIGAHILSGAVMDPTYFFNLFPSALKDGAPLDTMVTHDSFHFLGIYGDMRIPSFIMPPFMHNKGNYIISLGKICKWMASQAEALGVEIYTGMAVSKALYDNRGRLYSIIAGEFGLDKNGMPSDQYEPGMEIQGKYTLLAEGARGSLSKEVINRYHLAKNASPQKYGLGFKELWEVPKKQHQQGSVIHTMGYPLIGKAGGGGFMYHLKDNLVSVGCVVHLDYENPSLSPYDEFQALKQHPLFKQVLQGGKVLSYGARAITEGGLQSIPKLSFPGGALIGCAAGFVNVPRIKGTHNALYSGVLAARAAVKNITLNKTNILESYETEFKNSSIQSELNLVKNVKPLWSRFGLLGALFLGGIEMWIRHLTKGKCGLFKTLNHRKADHETLKPITNVKKIHYPAYDQKITFDKLTSVSRTGTYHAENTPCHLKLKDPDIPINFTLPYYDEPAQRYCPAGVYEIVSPEKGKYHFQINAQNCIHCKTCDIKEPKQNIDWKTPQGGEGPNYTSM